MKHNDTPHRKNGNMARMSNKDKALAYAASKGIILTMEDADAGDELGAGAIEVWSLDAHLSESGSDCHTYFARGNTEPRAWADALAYMLRLTECADDCPCRDHSWFSKFGVYRFAR